ncbi:MAG TPA: myo-inosose-2 dehydratase [Steroidobacteraceae bacterium]|nr:myo-inosose-2 dehydratase [Steroidobacteraceae bacterium]
MSIRFGVSPIAWINDDMPELGADTSLEQVLGEARDIGFAGIELGARFPRDAATLAALLARFQLVLVAGWYGASLLTRSAREEIAALQAHLGLLRALGCTVFIIAETSNAIHGKRNRALSASPRLDRAGWARFGEKLTEVADHVAAAGMRLAYHHHLGTVVESGEDLERLLESTGAAVGMTIDTGHAALGGVDAVALIRTHPQRVAHVHCKDIRGEIFRKLKAQGGSFLSGVLAGMFTVPGDGDLDFRKVVQALAAIGYSGWIIVEAEQDPTIADPRRYGELGLTTLRREAAAAGLRTME